MSAPGGRHAGGVVLVAAVAAGLIGGCASRPPPEGIEPDPVQMSDLAKSDLDAMAEIHLEESLADLRALMLKLYRRNPREWRRTGKASAEGAVAALFDGGLHGEFAELGGARGTDAVQLAFDGTFHGDRVLAFVQGLTTMVLASYGGKTEFYLTDQLDPQKLYNGARNIEIAVWKLNSARTAGGAPFLLANSTGGEVRNLSFERLFGKLIARQDAMARIVAVQTNRRITKVIQRLVSAVFLPI